MSEFWVASTYSLQHADPPPKESYAEFSLKRIIRWAAASGLMNGSDVLQKLLLRQKSDFFSEFGAIDILTREKTRAWFRQMQTRKTVPAYYLHTSGSTGSPMNFSVDQSHFLRRAFIIDYLLHTLHLFKNPRILRLAYADMPWSAYQGEYLNPHNLDAIFLKKLLVSRRPAVLYGTVSRCATFAEFLSANAITHKFDAVITRSEHLTPIMRKLLKDTLGGEVYNIYASREFGPIGQECREQNGFHINDEALYIEVSGKDGRPVENGAVGNVTITSFFNRSLPFIRYDIGDRGKILTEPCTCGLPTKKIIFEGRECDFILLPDGKKFPALDLCIPLNELNTIKTFQLVQRSEKELWVRITIPPNTERNGAIRSVQNALKKFMETRAKQLPAIRVAVTNDIPLLANGKRPLLTSDGTGLPAA